MIEVSRDSGNLEFEGPIAEIDGRWREMMQVTGVDLGEILHEQEGPSVKPEVFLKRLRRLLVLRYQASNYLDPDDVRLLDHCVFATFCECLEVGAGEQARRYLDEARAAQIRAGS